MEMEFVGILKILWRWLWLIVLIVGTTCALLYFNPGFSVVGYQAEVTILFSTPDREDAAVFDDYIFTSERDEVTIAINKFIEIAQYPEVTRRTLAELNIEETYDVALDAELGADFIYITVEASTPELAAQIANAHAENAIEFFGEIRAMPTTAALTYFTDELALAQTALDEAEIAMSNFQIEHQVIDLDSELQLQYDVLEELEVSRARMRVYQVTGGRVNSLGDTTTIAVTEEDISNVDALISAQRTIIANLAALETEYHELEDEVERAREHHDYLSTLQIDVETRNTFANEALFMQVIQAASLPDAPQDDTVRTLVLGALGSLGFSILLAFFLDYVLKRW